MSLEIGTFKRIATVTLTAAASGAAGPIGAVKIGSDSVTSKDVYASVAFSTVPV